MDSHYQWNTPSETLKFMEIFQNNSLLPEKIAEQFANKKEHFAKRELVGFSPKDDAELPSVNEERDRLQEVSRQDDKTKILETADLGRQLIKSLEEFGKKKPTWDEFSKLLVSSDSVIRKLELAEKPYQNIAFKLKGLILAVAQKSIGLAIEAVSQTPIEKWRDLSELQMLNSLLRSEKINGRFQLGNRSELREAFSENVIKGLSSSISPDDLAERLSFAKKYADYITPAAKEALEEAKDSLTKAQMEPYEKWNADVAVQEKEILQIIQRGGSLTEPSFRQKLQKLHDTIIQFEPPNFLPSILLTGDQESLLPRWVQFRLEGSKSLNISELQLEEQNLKTSLLKGLQDPRLQKKLTEYKECERGRQKAYDSLQYMFNRDPHTSVEDLITDEALTAVEKSLERNEKRVAELQAKLHPVLPSDEEIAEKENRLKMLEPSYRNDLELLESRFLIEIQELGEMIQKETEELNKFSIQRHFDPSFESFTLDELQKELIAKKKGLKEVREKMTEANSDRKSEVDKQSEAEALRSELDQIRTAQQAQDPALDQAIDRLNNRRDLRDNLAYLKEQVNQSNSRMAEIIEELASPVNNLLTQAVKIGNTVIETDLREYARGMDVGPALADYIERGDSTEAVKFYTDLLYNRFKDVYPFEFVWELRATLEYGIREKLGAIA